ncbi:hypothetical protein JCM12294_49090 [Desulfocicer niacini]
MLVVTAAVLLFYFSKFHGPLSGITGDWGNFGSYLNGVLSPILLFSTLIYLARTLQVQRDLQADQRKEFETANENQQRHIEELEKASQQQQVAALRTELVKFINNEIAIEEKYSSDLNDQLQKKVSKGWGDENDIKVVEGLPKQLTDSFNRRLNLRNIASCLISDNFKTVDELREYFNNRYKNLIENFGKIYT